MTLESVVMSSVFRYLHEKESKVRDQQLDEHIATITHNDQVLYDKLEEIRDMIEQLK